MKNTEKLKEKKKKKPTVCCYQLLHLNSVKQGRHKRLARSGRVELLELVALLV